MFELVDNVPQNAVIKVIGVGGGGGNAVNHMLNSQVEGVDFIVANTDAQALKHLNARTLLQLGTGITKGLPVQIQKLAVTPLWKTKIVLPRYSVVPTWSSSLPVWVVVPARVRRLL